MSNPCRFERDGDSITIFRSDRNEIMFTTYREDYWEDLISQTWRLNAQGYPTCSRLGDLHRYIMGKWYGEDVLEDLTQKGYVVDHLDNEHNNCRISNLEFLNKDFNTAKGQWLDKQIKKIQLHFALAIFKDFDTQCYQITLGMNDPFDIIGQDGDHHISSMKFLYDSDYPIVIKDAEMMLLDLERNQFDPEKYNACAKRICECPDINLTEEERNSTFVIRDGEVYLMVGNGRSWIMEVSPDKGWTPFDED